MSTVDALASVDVKPSLDMKPLLNTLPPIPSSLTRGTHDPLTNPTSRDPGSGTLHLTNPNRAQFATLHGSYPLKLLAPSPLPSQPPNVGMAYMLAYGGGLVAGDKVALACSVDAGCTLVLLTQGSTKVFKHRMGMRPLSHGKGVHVRLKAGPSSGPASTANDVPKDATNTAPTTRQRLHINVAPGALILLLPDSLSPFRDSRYAQAQRVVLANNTSSALILDWVNSGRGKRPAIPGPIRSDEDEEVWAMACYASTNEIVLETGASEVKTEPGVDTPQRPPGRIVARERTVLDNAPFDTAIPASGLTPLARRLAPYHVYVTVLIHGPHLVRLRETLQGYADGTSQFQVPRPPGVLWSWSVLSDAGGILRVAGLEVEEVRDWLRVVFTQGGVGALVGEGLWPRCI